MKENEAKKYVRIIFGMLISIGEALLPEGV